MRKWQLGLVYQKVKFPTYYERTTFPTFFFFIDKNMHFCYILGNGFLRNRPIYDNLSLQDENEFAIDDLTYGSLINKGVTNEKNLPSDAHRAFFNHAD